MIVLTGSGKYFCTGMDLGNANQAKMSTELESRQQQEPEGAAKGGIHLYEAFNNCKKPLIARINGPALGGGW